MPNPITRLTNLKADMTNPYETIRAHFEETSPYAHRRRQQGTNRPIARSMERNRPMRNDLGIMPHITIYPWLDTTVDVALEAGERLLNAWEALCGRGPGRHRSIR